jgi:hypothetical protein
MNVLVVGTSTSYAYYLYDQLLLAGHQVRFLHEADRQRTSRLFTRLSLPNCFTAGLTRRQIKIITYYLRNPIVFFFYIYTRLSLRNFFARTHEKTLLVFGYLPLLKRPHPHYSIPSVSQISQAHPVFHDFLPDLTIVHGTSLIDPASISVFSSKSSRPVINIHWGFSPFYRGEGIVTCLANNDIKYLGVTVHKLTEQPDAGSIYASLLVALDKSDTPYSIGLKMTKLATRFIISSLSEHQQYFAVVAGSQQDLSLGACYSTFFMYTNPHIYHKARAFIRECGQ